MRWSAVRKEFCTAGYLEGRCLQRLETSETSLGVASLWELQASGSEPLGVASNSPPEGLFGPATDFRLSALKNGYAQPLRLLFDYC
jgi:hypothetical protein